MKCRLCEDKLIEYLYGELPEEDAAAMEEHLESSEACRRTAERHASVLEIVGSVEEEDLPRAVHTRIMGHAEEAGTKRRSFGAWVFRPAVTTAVICAIAAGVYFTSIRHKPPSYRDERIVSEQSLLEKSRERRTSAPLHATTDRRDKEAQDRASRARLAEPPGTLEKSRAAAEQRAVSEKKKEPLSTPPSEREEPALEEDRMDEGRAYRFLEEKAESIPAQVPGAVSGRADSPHRRAARSLASSEATSSSLKRDLVALQRQVPEPIEGARELASEGNCSEAEKQVEAYATTHPQDAACGAGWLEAARCFSEKGDIDTARRLAEKALEIRSSEQEAQAFLESLPSTAK